MLWNATYETGIPIIDQQHKELFRHVDILMDKSQVNRVPETLTFLGSYVIRHFSTEEGMHVSSKYPKAAEHKKAHADFINAYKTLAKEYVQSGESPVLLMKLSKTALDWLKEHIRGQDKEFAAYYKTVSR